MATEVAQNTTLPETQAPVELMKTEAAPATETVQVVEVAAAVTEAPAPEEAPVEVTAAAVEPVVETEAPAAAEVAPEKEDKPEAEAEAEPAVEQKEEEVVAPPVEEVKPAVEETSREVGPTDTTEPPAEEASKVEEEKPAEAPTAQDTTNSEVAVENKLMGEEGSKPGPKPRIQRRLSVVTRASLLPQTNTTWNSKTLVNCHRGKPPTSNQHIKLFQTNTLKLQNKTTRVL